MHLTAKLPPGGRDKWNVRVVVKITKSTDGWNHTKMNIRDGFAVLTSSLETGQYELGMHVAGNGPGTLANEWYDTIWANHVKAPAECFPATLCGVRPLLPLVNSEPGYADRGVNMFSLRRGWLPNAAIENIEADRALFAGMAATQNTAFFLNPGLTSAHAPYTGQYSWNMVNRIADTLANDIDVKFVWGSQGDSPRDDATLEEIYSRVYDRLSQRLAPGRELNNAFCKFHIADYAPASHAKFYMLDDGFYIGSQNLYPSGIGSQLLGMPELDEFGYFVDAMPGVNMDLAQQVRQVVVEPVWNSATMVGQYCTQVRSPVRIEGHTAGTPPTHTCSGTFDVVMNYHNVDYDESAAVTASGTCTSAQGPVAITLHGAIGTDRRFRWGRITGTVAGRSDSADLTGTVQRGEFRLAFSGLEPISGISYSGTVASP
jgi:hypothetical protein